MKTSTTNLPASSFVGGQLISLDVLRIIVAGRSLQDVGLAFQINDESKTMGKVYRVRNNGDELEKVTDIDFVFKGYNFADHSVTSEKVDFEFKENIGDFNFAFFSFAELELLVKFDSYDYVLVTGIKLNLGSSFQSDKEIFTLKLELIQIENREDDAFMDNNPIGFPLLLIGLPCPPSWAPNNGLVNSAHSNLIDFLQEISTIIPK